MVRTQRSSLKYLITFMSCLILGVLTANTLVTKLDVSIHSERDFFNLEVQQALKPNTEKNLAIQKTIYAQRVSYLESKTKALAPQKTDYELAADMTSLLAYPHLLNSFTELNQALQQQPRKNLAIVQARFEIMLQPEQYNLNDALYAALDRLMAKKEEATPNFSVENLFCSEQACEIQLNVGKPSPYFDSRRWLLDYLAQEPLLVSPTLSFSTDSGSSSESYGLIMLTTR